jgi:hypothetical protein
MPTAAQEISPPAGAGSAVIQGDNGGVLINDSNYPVWVRGNRYGADTTVQLPARTDSRNYGFTDVDFIWPVQGYPIREISTGRTYYYDDYLWCKQYGYTTSRVVNDYLPNQLGMTTNACAYWGPRP